jgi:hypothetical protein
MRWSFLLLLLTVAPSFGQTAAAPSDDFNLLRKPATSFDAPRFTVTPHRSKYRKLANIVPESDPVCFTVKTYMVERMDAESDVTRVVGSSSCQWSSQFAVKSAVEVVK